MSGDAVFRYDLSLSPGPGYTEHDLTQFRIALARAQHEAESWGMHVHDASVQIPEEMTLIESGSGEPQARTVKVVVTLAVGAEGA